MAKQPREHLLEMGHSAVTAPDNEFWKTEIENSRPLQYK
jgi:hypothetical protein